MGLRYKSKMTIQVFFWGGGGFHAQLTEKVLTSFSHHLISKCISCVFHVLRYYDFLFFFPIVSPWKLLETRRWKGLDCQNMSWGPFNIYIYIYIYI